MIFRSVTPRAPRALLTAAALALCLLAAPAWAAGPYFVTAATDDGLGSVSAATCANSTSSNTTCTLSSAIAAANAAGGSNTIYLRTDVMMTGVMWKLIASNITVQSDGTRRTVACGTNAGNAGNFRPFFVRSGSVVLSDLNVAYCKAVGGSGWRLASGGGGAGAGLGGALFVYGGSVTVQNVNFSGTSAVGGSTSPTSNSFTGGGGMYGKSDGTANSGGGGLFNDGSGSLGGTDVNGSRASVVGSYGGGGGFGGFGGGGGGGGDGGFGGGGGGTSAVGGSGGFGGGGGSGDGIGGDGGFGGGSGDGIGDGGGGGGMGGSIFVAGGTLTLKSVNFTSSSAAGGTAPGATNGKGYGGAIFVCTSDLDTNATLDRGAKGTCVGGSGITGTGIDTANSCGVSFSGTSAADGQPDVYWSNGSGGQAVTTSLGNACSDAIAPVTPALSINSGAARTNAASVAIAITNDTDNIGVDGWYVSESSSAPSLAGGFGWVGTRPTTATLSAGDGSKTLYVWTRDAGRNVSAAAGSATIILDSTTTGAASSITATGATLVGTVNDNGSTTTVSFDYGLTTVYGTNVAATPASVAIGAGSTAVSKAVTGLTCNTTYHFSVKAVTGLATTNGSDATFTTAVCAPTVSTVAPTSGPTLGGTSVVIIGTNLTGASAVSFGGIAASSFTVDSATQITATTPAHAAGALDVVVTTAVGSVTSVGAFSYALSSQTVSFAPTASVTLGVAPVVLSASSTSGLTSFTFATSSAASICTVVGNTLTYVGAGTCALTAMQSGNANFASATASATVVINAAPVPEPTALIPAFSALPAIAGLGARPSILDLSAGSGPSMAMCLADTVRAMLGSNFAYLGQNADGILRFGSTESFVSTYPLSASSGGSLQPSFTLQGSNLLQVGTSCGSFMVAPALYSLREFGAFLNAAGFLANMNAQGVFTLDAGGAIYAFRPEYVVSHVAPTGVASLVIGADGVYRFTDSAGNVQRLLPAFLDSEVLSNQVAQAVGGSTVIQTDGTALVTLFGGQQFVLTPDLILGGVPPEFIAVSWWQDGVAHYRYRVASIWAMSQGFTVTPRP
jgi:hypothetical protein